MAVQKLLLAKEEVTYGVDPTPDSSNAIETMNLEVERYGGDKTQRDLDRNVLGGQETIATSPQASASFAVGFASSGTAGTAPAHGVLWKACGFDEVVTGSEVTYQLAETQNELSASDSATLWDYRSQASKVQKLTGVRGKNAISMGAGDLPKIEFSDMIGSYSRPSELATPTGVDWSGWNAELPFTNANMPVLTLNSESACTEQFSIDFGQSVSRRNLPGCSQTIISGYEVTGNIVIVAPSIALVNWFATLESHQQVNKVPFALVLGTTAGAICEIAAAEVQLQNISEGESAEGDLTYSIDLSFLDRPIVTFK